jgi:hypothetical protein
MLVAHIGCKGNNATTFFSPYINVCWFFVWHVNLPAAKVRPNYEINGMYIKIAT